MRDPETGIVGSAATEASGAEEIRGFSGADPVERSRRSDLGSPEGTLIAFVAALRRRDLEKASACLAPDACFLTPDATAIHGRAEIVEVLSQLRASAIDLRCEMRAAALHAGDTALTAERWTVRAPSRRRPVGRARRLPGCPTLAAGRRVSSYCPGGGTHDRRSPCPVVSGREDTRASAIPRRPGLSPPPGVLTLAAPT